MFVCFYFSVIGGGGSWAKKKNVRGGGGGWVILSRVGQSKVGQSWSEKEMKGNGVVKG